MGLEEYTYILACRHPGMEASQAVPEWAFDSDQV